MSAQNLQVDGPPCFKEKFLEMMVEVGSVCLTIRTLDNDLENQCKVEAEIRLIPLSNKVAFRKDLMYFFYFKYFPTVS